MIFTIRPICPVGGGAWPTMTGNLEQRAGVLPFGAAVQVVKVSGEPPDLDCAKQFHERTGLFGISNGRGVAQCILFITTISKAVLLM